MLKRVLEEVKNKPEKEKFPGQDVKVYHDTKYKSASDKL